ASADADDQHSMTRTQTATRVTRMLPPRPGRGRTAAARAGRARTMDATRAAREAGVFTTYVGRICRIFPPHFVTLDGLRDDRIAAKILCSAGSADSQAVPGARSSAG